MAALQVPLFTAVVAPAAVGLAIALGAGAEVAVVDAGLVLLALIMIQAGANLQKGLVESADRGDPSQPASSIFVFDSGAVEVLGWPRNRLKGLAGALFGIGGTAGLYLVVIYGDPVLLALGVVGGLLGFFYSAPPLKLSYRGVGEVATFLAFGPLLVVGVAYLFSRVLLPSALGAGVVMGFLAALISYERYFPLVREDAGKGKRTPVVILGPRRATKVLWLLLSAPHAASLLAFLLGEMRLLPFLATGPLAAVLAMYHSRGLNDDRLFGRAVAVAVLLHLVGGVLLAASYLLL
jgi:1,4-dihydroxy-2-naphthoate octaprenyltransferase